MTGFSSISVAATSGLLSPDIEERIKTSSDHMLFIVRY
jgi:hypothetical protein